MTVILFQLLTFAEKVDKALKLELSAVQEAHIPGQVAVMAEQEGAPLLVKPLAAGVALEGTQEQAAPAAQLVVARTEQAAAVVVELVETMLLPVAAAVVSGYLVKDQTG